MVDAKQTHLTPDNPWPGLDSFDESDAAYFHGRDREVADLLRMVKRETLTVLFGRSGLGKTSILGAGLFPRLRQDGYVPVYVRLDFTGGGPSLRRQILDALAAECASRQIEATSFDGDQPLWQFFHRRDVEFWNEKNRLLTPLIVLDQFEEAFTLGYEDDLARSSGRAFLAELGDLIENRMPRHIKEAIDRNPEADFDLDFTKSDFKIILSLREDYLAHLEALKQQIPALTYNRYRLLPMDGNQADEVVGLSGGHLVEEGVAGRIIGIAAGSRKDGRLLSPEDYAETEIDPALLSVICSELNHRRQALGQPRITQDLIQGAGQQILADFYQRSLEGLGPAVRVFVEDELLTDKGFRDSYPFDDALGLPGIGLSALNALVEGRLLRVDERFGVRRLELTHDVLTHVVKESRDTRKAREAEAAARARELEAVRRQRRNRIVSLLLVLGLALVVGAGGLVADLWRQVDELQAQTLQRAKSLLLAQSRWFQAKQYDLALLLNVEAYRLAQEVGIRPAHDVKAEFANAFSAHPFLDGFFYGDDKLFAVAYSPDGQWLVAAGADNTLSLWDVKARRLAARLSGHEDAVLAVAFSPDGKTLASAGKDKTVILWDAATRKPLFPPLAGQQGAVEGIAFSPDGKTLATAGEDGATVLWDVATGQQRVEFPRSGYGALFGVAYGLDGRRLVLAGEQMSMLELDTRKDVALEGHHDRVLAVALSPNGKILASAGADRKLMLWDVQSLRPHPIGDDLSKHETAFWGLGFSSSGALLAGSGENGKIVLWVLSSQDNQADAMEATVLQGHQGPVRSVAFHPGGKLLASAGDDHRVIQWNLDQHALLRRLEVAQGPVWGLSFSPDGRYLVSADDKGQVRFWDYATGKELGALPQQGPVLALAHSPDGRWLATAREDRGLQVWELPPDSMPGNAKAIPLAGSEDAVSVLGLAFSPDGKFLASAGMDGSLTLWDLAGRTRLASLARQGEPVRGLAFSPDGRLLVSVGDDQNVNVWDLAKRELRHKLAGNGPRLYAAAFSPDGQLLAAAGQDRVLLWEVATGRQIDSLPARAGSIRSLAFSPDGALLASAGQDGSLLLWDVAAKKVLTALAGHQGRVLAVAFSPDGQTIATSGDEGTVALWNWNLDALARQACRIANRNLSCAEWAEYLGGKPYRPSCEGLPLPEPPCR